MFPKFINLSSSDFDDFILENSLEIFDDRFLIVTDVRTYVSK